MICCLTCTFSLRNCVWFYKQNKQKQQKRFSGGSRRCSNHSFFFFRGLYCLFVFFVFFGFLFFFADAIHTVRLQTEHCIPTPLRRGLCVIRRDVPADTYQRMSIWSPRNHKMGGPGGEGVWQEPLSVDRADDLNKELTASLSRLPLGAD